MIDKTMEEGINNRLKGRLFGLLCEFEKDGEWEKFLDSIITELLGYDEEDKTLNYYVLLAKLQSLKYLKYEYFRRTIFDCISLVGR